MGTANTRASVPHFVVPTVIRFARAQRYDIARLTDGLDFERKTRWWPGEGVPWDDVAELFARLEQCAPDAVQKFGRHYVDSFPLLTWLAAYVFSVDRLYRLVFRAWGRVWPLELRFDRTSDGYRAELRHAADLRSGAALFRVGAEILRLLPGKLDLAHAEVEAHIEAHGCVYYVHLPTTVRDEATDEEDELFRHMTADVISRLTPPEPPLAWSLTPAQTRIVRELVAGRSIKDIAVDLDLSLATVRTHVRRAMDKAGIHRQAELVSVVLQRGSRDRGDPSV